MALLYAAFVLNVTPGTLHKQLKTPFERVYGRVPDLKRLGVHVFGCKVVYGLTKVERMKTPEAKMHELTFEGYFVGYSGNLILIYVDNRIVTGNREKTQFFEGIFVGRNPPKTSNPDTVEDEVREDVQEVMEAQGAKSREQEEEDGESGLEVIRSERALRPPEDIYNKILHDFQEVQIGEMKVFDETLPDLPAELLSENTIGASKTAAPAESVIEKRNAGEKDYDPQDGDTVDKDESAEAAKIAEYEGKHLLHSTGAKGKIIGAQLRKPRGKKHRMWYLRVKWDDDPVPTFRPEHEATGHVRDNEQHSDVEAEAETDHPSERDDDKKARNDQGEPDPKQRRRSTRLSNSNSRIVNFVTKIFTIFAVSRSNGGSEGGSNTAVSSAMPSKEWPEPKTVYDCMIADDYKGWWLAMRSEYLSWRKLSVFEIVSKQDRDRSRNTYPLQDIWKRKWKPNGMFDKWKLRLCVLGNLFRRGVDCSANTYAPTVSATAARLFFALAVQLGLQIWGLDVKTAYLTAKSSGKYYTFFPNVFKMAEMCEEHSVFGVPIRMPLRALRTPRSPMPCLYL